LQLRFAKTENNKNQILLMNKNNSMNLEGLSYVAPSVNVLDVQAEGVLCGSYYLGGGGVYDDDDMNDNGEY
jgi:hypothetical protein